MFGVEKCTVTQVKHYYMCIKFESFVEIWLTALCQCITKTNFTLELQFDTTDEPNRQANISEIVESKHKEIQCLSTRGKKRALLKENFPERVDILTARSVLAIKSKLNNKIRYKARLAFGRRRKPRSTTCLRITDARN